MLPLTETPCFLPRRCSFSIAASVVILFSKRRAGEGGNIRGLAQGCTCFQPLLLTARLQCLMLSRTSSQRADSAIILPGMALGKAMVRPGNVGHNKNTPPSPATHTHGSHLLHSRLPFPPNPGISTPTPSPWTKRLSHFPPRQAVLTSFLRYDIVVLKLEYANLQNVIYKMSFLSQLYRCKFPLESILYIITFFKKIMRLK